MKLLKYLLWLVLVLAIVGVGSIFVITNLVDPNDYKPQIAEQVKKHTGRDISLDGELSLTFFPWVGIETGKVSLANAAGFDSGPMVSVDNARAKVKLIPLLKKQVEVDTIILDKPVVRLTTKADGTTNWDDLVKKTSGGKSEEKDAAKNNAEKGAGAIAGLAVQGVSINDGYVEWNDGKANQNLKLQNLNLSTGTLVPGEPLDISMSVDAEGNLLPEPGSLKVDTTITLNDDFSTVLLENIKLSLKAKTISTELDATKISYLVNHQVVAVNGISADVEYLGVKSELKAPIFNFDQVNGILELPELKLKQEDASLSASFIGAGIPAQMEGDGSIDLDAGDINALLTRNGISLPELTQSLKEVALDGSMRLKGQTLDLSGLSLKAMVNELPTSIKADELSVNLATQAIKANGVDIQQTDFKLRSPAIVVGANAETVQGSVDLAVADIAKLISRNGIPLELPALKQSLKNVVLQSSVDLKNNNLAISGLSLDAVVNDLPTSIKATSLNVDLSTQAISASGFDARQTDFMLKAPKLSVGPSAETVSGNVELRIADIAALVERNAIPVEMPELPPLSNISLNASVDTKGDVISAQNVDLKLEHMGQPTSVAIPAASINLKSGALKLKKIDLVQGDATLSANASGSGVTGGLEKMKLKGKLVANLASVPDLLKRNGLEIELPPGLVDVVSVSGDFSLEDNNLALRKLDAKLNDMTVAGNVRLNNLAKPGYQFDLAINTLDLDKLVGGESEDAAAASTAKSSQTPSTAEQLLLPVAPLRGLNVDGKAKIGKFITTGITLKDVNIVVKSSENVLRIVPLTAKVFGGTIENQMSYDVSGDMPKIKMINKVSNVDIGALLAGLEITEKIAGTGNLSTNLTGAGANPDALIGSLTGDIDFRLLDGAIKGYDLQAKLIELEKQVNSYKGKETKDRGEPAAETKFAELSGTLKANKGVFRNNDLSMKAPLFRLGGEGVIDLTKSRLDYKLDVNVVESVEGQGGKSLSDLRGARIPFKIYGPLDAPSYTLDLASIVKEQAKKELKKKLFEKLKLAPEVSNNTQSSQNLGSGQASAAQAPEQPPEDPKDALERQLKKKLGESLLKGLFN